jgi:hypothetical protein
MLLSLALLLLEVFFGIAVFDFFDPRKKFAKIEWLIAASASGAILSPFFILVLGLLTKSLDLAIAIFMIIASAIFILRFRTITNFISSLFPKQTVFSLRNFCKPWLWILVLILMSYGVLLSTVLFRSPEGHLRGVEVGWGDVAFHLSLIERFATAEPFVLDHPILAGANLKYPFLINFISGIFRKLGSDQVLAFALPLYFFGLSSLVLIFLLARRLLRSANLALLALALIVFGSGLGFLVFFKDLAQGYETNSLSGIAETFKNPPHEYTHLDNRTGGKPQEKNTDDNIVWIVPAISSLSHQRSFVVGLVIFSLILFGIYYYGREKQFWRFGILTGLLPFAHGHTLLAVFLILAVLFWFHLKNWRTWIIFAVLATLIIIPQLNYLELTKPLLNNNIFRPWFGWMTCEHSDSWFYCDTKEGTVTQAFSFWSKNFGIIFWLWCLALCMVFFINFGVKKLRFFGQKFDVRFILASLAVFLVGNFFLLQPWPFDNNKLLFYWWLLAIIFGAAPLIRFFWHRMVIGRALAVFLITFGMLAGILDFSYRTFGSRTAGYFGYADASIANQELASWIKTNTLPNNLFLTAPGVDPVPLFLAGRPLVMGFEGWLWSHGQNYAPQKANAQKIFEGDLALACEKKIDYILLDNAARHDFPGANTEALHVGAEVVFKQTLPEGDRELLKPKCR